MTRLPILLSAVLGSLCLAGTYLASTYADDVVSATPGVAGGGDPLLMTGPPVGAGINLGSSHIWQLGVGGQTVLELGFPAANGPGTDLIVYENPFLLAGEVVETWIECAFVEVSSDNTSWVRFPTRYQGDVGPFGSGPTFFEGAANNWYRGLAGVMPCMANLSEGIDPMDVVAGGGDAFDLADLAGLPEVVNGEVNLDFIRYVRLTDVVGGVDVDDAGTPIWDCGDPFFAGADIDAIAAINTTGNQLPGRPKVELTYLDDVIALSVEDSEGINDFKFGFTSSWSGIELGFYSFLLPIFTIIELTPTKVVMAVGPIPQDFPQTLLKVAVRDNGGLIGGDTLTFP